VLNYTQRKLLEMNTQEAHLQEEFNIGKEIGYVRKQRKREIRSEKTV
jgi:hypothetical protein